MNNCSVCGKETKNKKYCSMKCRDVMRKRRSFEKRKCKTCGKEMEVRKKTKKEYCSPKCVAENKEVQERKQQSAKKTNLEKYGVEHPSMSEKVKNKIKKTNLKKYDVEYSWQSEKVKNKIKKTNIKKYGVEYPQQNNKIKEKSKRTWNKKYGGYILQSKELRKKAEDTILEKYGVKNVRQSKKVENKIIETNLKKYGSEYGLSSQEVIAKRQKTLIDKYGNKITNISQVPEVRGEINRTIMKNFYNRLFNSDRLKDLVEPLFSFDEYDGNKEKHRFRCKKCNTIFEDNLRDGKIPRCLSCYPLSSGTSLVEKEVGDFISSIYNGKIIYRDKKLLNGSEIDILLPEKKIAIEVNGLYWHSELNGKDKNYHLNKTLKAEDRGFYLIHIFEDEWIYKQNIVKNRLKNLFGKLNRIYARNCEIKEIDSQLKNHFLEGHHIQGVDKSKIKLGLFYNNDLVGVMTFGTPRFSQGDKDKMEIIRFATSINIVGGASKLIKYFQRNYSSYNKLITFADRRWTKSWDNLYERIGFTKVGETNPGYYYIKKYQRHNRLNFQFHLLENKLEKFDPNLTEWENMQLNGYDRIWDCGNLKYEYDF